MHFIEHIIEPTKLLLAWQSADEQTRGRYIIAELNKINDNISLHYLVDSPDFKSAEEKGFVSYPAFPDTGKSYSNVLNAFMRRLTPRTRGDFPNYLEELRLQKNVTISDFGLLGYSGAKLPSDGFSVIHPFNNVQGSCELLLEVAGYRYYKNDFSASAHLGSKVSFATELNQITKAPAIQIRANEHIIGYVNKGLLPTFFKWMKDGRIIDAWIEKTNGTPERPTAYVYVKVAALRASPK